VEEYLSERERWEELKQFLRVNGPSVIATAAIVGVGIGGYQWWRAHSQQQAMEAATKYEQLMKAYEAGDKARSVALIDELQRDHSSSPYSDQAALMAARVHVDNNELDAAASTLRGVMEHSRDKQLQLVARLRLARVQLAQNRLDEATRTLDAAQPGAFAPRFDEVRGDIALARGDKAAALKAYQQARQSSENGVIDTELLDLKISDLAAAQPQPTAASTGKAAPAEDAGPAAPAAPATTPPPAKAP